MQISKLRYAAKPKKQWITKLECDSQQLHTARPRSSALSFASIISFWFLKLCLSKFSLNDLASSAIYSTFLLNKKHHKLNILATKTNEWHKQQLHLNLATKHSHYISYSMSLIALNWGKLFCPHYSTLVKKWFL